MVMILVVKTMMMMETMMMLSKTIMSLKTTTSVMMTVMMMTMVVMMMMTMMKIGITAQVFPYRSSINFVTCSHQILPWSSKCTDWFYDEYCKVIDTQWLCLVTIILIITIINNFINVLVEPILLNNFLPAGPRLETISVLGCTTWRKRTKNSSCRIRWSLPFLCIRYNF